MLDGFSVEAVRGGLLDRLFGRERQMERRAVALERQLNGGIDFLSSVNSYFQRVREEYREAKTGNTVQGKVDSCSFHLNSNNFSCSEPFLTCPITLDMPEVGVFMKNSRSSNICSLYDKGALLQLVEAGGTHPLSREPITVSMIMRQDECYFDSKREAFVVSDN